MQCKTSYDAVESISIQHNVIQCNGKKIYDAIQFNIVQIVHFYLFGSDKQQIIN